jgi:nucleoside-diphosphate-sugar epimerase
MHEMSTNNKRILITGGSGFIGTNLVTHFESFGYTIINLDMAAPRKKEHAGYWQKTNLLDAPAVKQVVAEFSPTHVVHLAARTDLDGRQAADYSANTEGTANLIAALNNIQSLRRVIFASSMLVCRPGYIPGNELDFAPATVYGESKKEMELMIRQKELPYEWLIIRPTSMWGPWFQTPYKDFFDRVIAKKMYNIKNRSCTKTYGFILNAVVQIEKLLFENTVPDKVYYIGDAPPLNITNWTNDIAAALKYTKPPAFPFFIFKMAAFAGDVLKFAGVGFPITSFRLKNMTTDNVLPLENLYQVTGPGAYPLDEAIRITLNWIKNIK